MFRLGGNTDQGIMSGVVPRQGYQNSGLADIPFEEWEKGKLTPRQMYEAAGDIVRPTGKSGDLSKFLIDFGLNIASAEPAGSILSTAAKEAKGPYERFQERKAARGAMSAESQADLFGQLFKGAIGGDERDFAHRDKAAMVRENMKQQFALQNQLTGLAPDDPTREKIKNDIRTLKKQISSPEFAETIKMMFSDERERR